MPNEEAVKIMNAMKPFIKRWFDDWSRSCIRSRLYTVTTAPNAYSISTTVDGALVSIDFSTFVANVSKSGIYVFTYYLSGWSFNNTFANLIDYGITFTDTNHTLAQNDTITVVSHNNEIGITEAFDVHEMFIPFRKACLSCVVGDVVRCEWTEGSQQTLVAVQKNEVQDTSSVYYVDFSGTIPSSGWSGSDAPYSLNLTVNGLLDSDSPIIDMVATGNYAVDSIMVSDWPKIYRVVATDNTLTFYATDIPIAQIPFKMRCIR